MVSEHLGSVAKPEVKKDTTKVAVVNREKKKAESSQPPTRSRDIKCFKCLGLGHIASQCPNKKVSIDRETAEEIVSKDETELKVKVEEEQVAHPEGELLVI